MMYKEYFAKLPKPDESLLPHKLKDIVILNGHARLACTLPVKIVLKHILLRSDTSYMNNRMNEIMEKDKNFTAESIERMKQSEFRDFIKDMVSGEQENIVESLHNLRKTGDEKEYQKAIQGWAKFGFGSEQKVDINVDINQKRSLIQAIADDYKYSEALDADFEDVDNEELKDHYGNENLLEAAYGNGEFNPYEKVNVGVIDPRLKEMIREEEEAAVKQVIKEYNEKHGIQSEE